jgi:uncharacterized protein DUF4388
LSEHEEEPAVRSALYELQRYLSDETAPMMAADSVELLLKMPPAIVASGVQGWVTAQYSGPGASVPVSDYIFHSLKRIHTLSELELLEAESVRHCIEEVGRILLEYCPEDDRDVLWSNISGLDVPDLAKTSRVEFVHRQVRGREPTGRGPEEMAASRDRAKGAKPGLGARGMSLLMDRLSQGTAPQTQAGADSDDRGELLTQVLATAAIQSESESELERNLRPLAKMGVDAELGQVFRALARKLPQWAFAPDSAFASPVASTSARTVDAMRRIISLAGDEREGTKRFGDMVDAAIEQFNLGSLVQAATMFNLAEQVVQERKLTSELLASIRARGAESLAPEQLRRFAEKPETHQSLRTVLNFFPALTVRGLLGDLEQEQRRDRRKLILALLEAHGLPARKAALERLQFHSDGEMDSHGYVRRNMVFLLRRIPLPAGTSVEDDLALLEQASRLGNPVLLVREAISALGQLRTEEAKEILTARLAQIEDTLLAAEAGAPKVPAMLTLLDRTVSALAAIGSAGALRAVVNHAVKRKRALGDTLARLENLAGHDLSGDKELVDRLVEMLKSDLPVKVLGLVLKNEHRMLDPLIRALSSTAAPAVRAVMEDIVRRFPDREFSASASKVLSGFGAENKQAEAAAETLSGEVELFGLPNLFQVIAESRLTGALALSDTAGEQIGTVSFVGGKISDCENGTLRGKAAFFQLFETPVRGTFAFQSRREASPDSKAEASLLEVLPMVVEGVRRHDEFREAKILVTGGARLATSSVPPTRPSTDEDQSFIDMVWKKCIAGVSPAELEDALGVDPYRVRHLLAHWVEEGALKPKSA